MTGIKPLIFQLVIGRLSVLSQVFLFTLADITMQDLKQKSIH